MENPGRPSRIGAGVATSGKQQRASLPPTAPPERVGLRPESEPPIDMVPVQLHNDFWKRHFGSIMAVSLSIKNVPEAIAVKLRARAERNHRSLQGELMAILEDAAIESRVQRADMGIARYQVNVSDPRDPRDPRDPPADGLLHRLMAIAGDRGIDTSKRLTRDEAHDRKMLRKAGV